MTARYPMDPEEPERAEALMGVVAENLVPLEPSADARSRMREALMARVRRSRSDLRSVTFVRPREDAFRDLMKGVRVLELSSLHHAVLLEFAPGASLPVHRHREDEECVVIRGSARIHDIEVQEGDYHLAYARSRHATVRSEQGALLYVRGTSIGSLSGVLRDLATAWIPGRGTDHVTLRAHDDAWVQMFPGVQGRILRDGDAERSMMIRMAPGACLKTEGTGCPTEAIIVAGEAYVGDERVGRGDYALIDRAGDTFEVSSDSGATIFLRVTDRGAAPTMPIPR